MIIKRSSKYNADGELWHDGRPVTISRVFGGLGFPRFAVLLGEERFYQETHYFVLAEAETERSESLIDLIDIARRFQAEYPVLRWFGWLDLNVKEILATYNKQSYSSGVRNLIVMDTPRIGEYIDNQVSLVHMLVRPAEKRLHFFNESMITGELFSLPQVDIRADKYHKVTALSNAVAGMLRYSGEQNGPIDPNPEPENWF